MGRKPDPERLQAIYQVIRNYPGERPGAIAALLGIARSSVTRLLPGLEAQGYRTFEDERGGLWPYQEQNQQ
jgi:Mn-dependent DtxR family transcriptional regulator